MVGIRLAIFTVGSLKWVSLFQQPRKYINLRVEVCEQLRSEYYVAVGSSLHDIRCYGVEIKSPLCTNLESLPHNHCDLEVVMLREFIMYHAYYKDIYQSMS